MAVPLPSHSLPGSLLRHAFSTLGKSWTCVTDLQFGHTSCGSTRSGLMRLRCIAHPDKPGDVRFPKVFRAQLIEPHAQERADVCARASGGSPLGDGGYWDQAEGKEKMKAIEEMRELMAEGEKFQIERDSEGDADGNQEEAAKKRTEELREELARRAKQQAEERKEAELMFQMAQRAYGRGTYDQSVELLEAALTNVLPSSNLGGEIQIWLAMAYEANNRHADCIALYKRIEQTHPNKATRRQAADLRYILEAPKLKISKDEMVSIPLIGSDDKNVKKWSQMVKERRKPKTKNKGKEPHDYLEDWLVWNPPRWERNPYFWVAFSIWLTLVAIALLYQT